MEALLTEEWLRDLGPVFVIDDASLSVVRARIKEVAAEHGVATEIADRAALVATELGRNHLRHARAGRIAVRAVRRGPHSGLEIVAVDRGPGLADVATAIDASPRAAGTLGVGVGSVRRLSSEVDFDVRLGEGTHVRARLFDEAAPRRREVGIYGRPHEEERVSGDHARVHRSDDVLVLAVCDGLGHGPLAREASLAAMAVFDEQADQPPSRILEECHGRLGATRGVVMAVCRAAEDTGTLETSSVGNIDVQVCAPRAARRIGGSSAVVGGRRVTVPIRVRTERVPFTAGELVIMTTDGISSKLSVQDDFALIRSHPIVVAQRIMERFARKNDDALVLVAR